MASVLTCISFLISTGFVITAGDSSFGFNVDAGEELMLFCGMAIGYKNPDAVINNLYSERQPLEEWAHFLTDE